MIHRIAVIIFVGLLVLGAQAGTVTQFGTLDGLMRGEYDGSATLSEIREHGDVGVGTFHALDGEMLVHEGRVFRVDSEGRVDEPEPDRTTPFAVVAPFEPGWTFAPDEALDFDGLRMYLGERLPAADWIYAVRIRGVFARVHTRSVPAQEKPYRPLPAVLATQPEFHFEDVSGVMVGFRFPPFARGVNAAGDHLHFVTERRDAGGHVLDFVTDDVVIEVTSYRDWRVILSGPVPNRERTRRYSGSAARSYD